MNQTEIDELRERIDAAISTVCNGMAAMSIPADPRDVDLVLADCAKALAALEEARAERGEARSLLLNGIQTNGDSLAFLEHVRREHAAVVAERDALKAKLAGAEDERDAYGADIHSVLEKSVGLVAERDALRAERDKANLRERNIFASLRMALGEDLGGGGGLVEILNGIEGLQDQRDAAETQAWDALGRPEGTHDTSNVQRLCEAHGALKAKLAEARAERLGYRAEYLELLRRIREGQLVTATEASMRYEGIIAASSEEPL